MAGIESIALPTITVPSGAPPTPGVTAPLLHAFGTAAPAPTSPGAVAVHVATDATPVTAVTGAGPDVKSPPKQAGGNNANANANTNDNDVARAESPVSADAVPEYGRERPAAEFGRDYGSDDDHDADDARHRRGGGGGGGGDDSECCGDGCDTSKNDACCRMWFLTALTLAGGTALAVVGSVCLATDEFPRSRCGTYGESGGFAMLNVGIFLLFQGLLMTQLMAGSTGWGIFLTMVGVYVPLFGGVNPIVLYHRSTTGLGFEEAYYQIVLYPMIILYLALIAAFSSVGKELERKRARMRLDGQHGVEAAQQIARSIGERVKADAQALGKALGPNFLYPLPVYDEFRHAGRNIVQRGVAPSRDRDLFAGGARDAHQAAPTDNDAANDPGDDLWFGACCRGEVLSDRNRAADPVKCTLPWCDCGCCDCCHRRCAPLWHCGKVFRFRESHALYLAVLFFSLLFAVNPWTICWVRLYEDVDGHDHCFGSASRGAYFTLVTNFLLACVLSSVARYPAVTLLGLAQNVRRRVDDLKPPKVPLPHPELLKRPCDGFSSDAELKRSARDTKQQQQLQQQQQQHAEVVVPLLKVDASVPGPAVVVERLTNGLRRLDAEQRAAFDALSWPMTAFLLIVIGSSVLCAISNLVEDFRTRNFGSWLQYLLFTIALNALVVVMLWAATSVEEQLTGLVGQLDAYVAKVSAVTGSRHAEVAYCRSVADYWRRQTFGFKWCGIPFSMTQYKAYITGLVSPLVTVFARQIYDWVIALPYFSTDS